MATLEELVEQAVLRKHEPDLENWEMPERCLYLTHTFDCSAGAILKPAPKARDRNLTPWEQTEQRFYEYVVGDPMTYYADYRKLEPLGQHVFELKTPDVRIFGWFARKRHFIATFGELKDKLSKERQGKSTNQLYKPYIEHAVWVRDQLQLDPPKHITGLSYADVL